MKNRVDQIKAEREVQEIVSSNSCYKPPSKGMDFLSPMKNKSERISQIIGGRIMTSTNFHIVNKRESVDNS